MRRKRRNSNKSKFISLDRLTDGARKQLESYKTDFESRIIHEAEGFSVTENRTEISESDVQRAKHIVHSISAGERKWIIRIIAMIGFPTLLSQIVTIAQLHDTSIQVQFLLFFQTALVLLLIIILTYFYRDDLL